MNIQTVAENLRNTIKGKEMLLSKTYEDLEDSKGNDLTSHAIAEFLEINIDELKRILQDVEQCAKQASDDSWIANPDRMGGSFTAEELDPNRGWV